MQYAQLRKAVDYMSTIEKILKLIKGKGITEKKFLLDLNFDTTALSQWKKGQNESYIKHIHKIADYFSVPTDYLLKEEWESPEQKLSWSDLDVSFYEGVDNLTDEEKEKIISYMGFLVSERKKNEDN